MEQRNRIAQFLDSQGLKEQALEVSIDPDHRFELAVQLGKLEVALDIAKGAGSEQKWKQLGDLALASARLDLAEQCLVSAEDINGLLLIHCSTGNMEGLENLAKTSIEKGKNNVAFLCYFLMRRVDDCLKLLCETGRIPEAAFLARTYLPSHVSEIVKLWRQDLQTINEKAAESLADPAEYENLFPEFGLALKAESYFNQITHTKVPASKYPSVREDLDRDLIEEIKSIDLSSIPAQKSVIESNPFINNSQSTSQTPVVVTSSTNSKPNQPSPTTSQSSQQSTPTKSINLTGSTENKNAPPNVSSSPAPSKSSTIVVEEDEEYIKFDDDDDDYGLLDEKKSTQSASVSKSLVDFDDLEEVEDSLLKEDD